MKTIEYKESEVGLIPADWTVKQIGKIGYTYSGLTGKGKDDFGKGDAKFITFLNVLNNPILRTDIFEKVTILEGEHQNMALKGDLFFNTSSETPEEVGICALLNDDIPGLYLNSFCFGYRLTDPEVDGLYLAYFFRSKQGRNIMSTLAQGATRYNLSKEYFNKTLIAFPPLPEQKRIAEAISKMDSLLNAQNEKIEKKRFIKDGLMSNILTGNIRVPGYCNSSWKEIELGSIGKFVSGNGFPLQFQGNNSGDYPFFKVSDFNSPGNELMMIKANNYISKDTAQKLSCNIIPKGAIFMAKIGAAIFLERKRQIVIDSCIDNNTFAFVPSESVDSLFMLYLFSRIRISDYAESTALPSVNIARLKQHAVNIPLSIEEQRAIAMTLNTIDNEILLFETEKSKYTQIKEGMMQQLLTGKTRL